jgi:hypothetical protein
MNTAASPLKPALINDPAKSAKNLAQTIAKQIAQEPWEILKQGGQQITGTEQTQRQESSGQQNEAGGGFFEENQKLASDRDRVRSQRLMQAYQAEIDEIKKKKEQEKTLKIQQEQMVQEQQKNVAPPLVEPASRKGRQLFNFGKKTQMQRQQTQTERPLPPSG